MKKTVIDGPRMLWGEKNVARNRYAATGEDNNLRHLAVDDARFDDLLCNQDTAPVTITEKALVMPIHGVEYACPSAPRLE